MFRSPRPSPLRRPCPRAFSALPELGRLDVGLPADIVILDDNVEIDRVLVGGRVHVAV